MTRATARRPRHGQTSLITSSRSTTASGYIPRSVLPRQPTSCNAGSALNTSNRKRHNAGQLEDEKQREAHCAYMKAIGFMENLSSYQTLSTINLDLPCVPCDRDGCNGSKRSACLDALPPDRVIQWISRQLLEM